MKTQRILLIVLLFCAAMHATDEQKSKMLEALEADAIPDEMMAKINALPEKPELYPVFPPAVEAYFKACEETAHTPDYTNYKRSSTWGKRLPEARFFNRECYAVPSRPLYYESITQAGETPNDVTGFLISGSDERNVQKVAEQLFMDGAVDSSWKKAQTNALAALKKISEEPLGDVDVALQTIEHGCEVIMASELRKRLLTEVGLCTHEADACSIYHTRVKAWLRDQQKVNGSKDLAIILFACIRGSIITE